MLVHALFFGAAIASGAGLASAQSLSLSNSCISSLQTLLTSPDAACLNAGALLSFVVGNNQSIPDTVNTWLTGLCASGSCTDDALASVVTNITTGCSEDLANAGIGQDITGSVVSIVQQVYPTARKVACLKEDSTSQLCVTSTLNNLESVIGKLDVTDLTFFNLIGDVQKLLSAGVQNLACTDCIKEGFTIASQDFPDIVSQVNEEAAGICGANFIDGSEPAGISQTDAPGVFTAQSTKDNGALASRGPVSFMGTLAVVALALTMMM